MKRKKEIEEKLKKTERKLSKLNPIHFSTMIGLKYEINLLKWILSK